MNNNKSDEGWEEPVSIKSTKDQPEQAFTAKGDVGIFLNAGALLKQKQRKSK